jgi:uncharacterized protein
VRKTRGALLWMLLALAAISSRAEVVNDLHAAAVPVANQSAEALTAASREGLAEVLVKVSGTRELLQKPVIVSALDDARNHVQQYSYVRRAPPATGLALRVEFDGPFITNLVKRAGAPLWTANRPTVLAWVMVEDEQGRHFINNDSAQQLQVLVEEFSRRGVPVKLPVFDLADTTAVNPEDAWRLDADVMRAASERYNVQDILVGRLPSAGEGQSPGEWTYLHDEEQTNRSVTAPDLPTFLRDGVDLVAGEMAARYAVAPTGGGHAGVRISVTGVTSYQDYAAIVRWLEGLELVDNAVIEKVQGDRIELRLQAQADAAHLATNIELNDRLVPVALPAAQSGPGIAPGIEPGIEPPGAETGAESGSSGQLNYQWRK